MSVKLVHDMRDCAGVVGLAKEVGARLDGSEKDIPVLPLYVCSLLDAIIEDADFEGAKHPIRSIAETFAWAFRAQITDKDALIKQAREFCKLIRRIDDDDGWPTDKWLNGILGCCLAIALGLEDAERIRWPAEAGCNVFQLRTGISGYNAEIAARKKSWICERLLKARQEAAAMEKTNDSP